MDHHHTQPLITVLAPKWSFVKQHVLDVQLQPISLYVSKFQTYFGIDINYQSINTIDKYRIEAITVNINS